MRPTRSTPLLAALAVAATLVLAACDDGDAAGTATVTTTRTVTTPTGTGGTTGAETTATATPVDTITVTLQDDLRELGFYDGGSTGVYDGRTRAAVRAFQESAGLAADGLAGPQTHLAIDFERGRTSSGTVRVLQQGLADLCHYSGPVNGVYTSATESAVAEFQREEGITVDGRFGPQTAVALVREHGNRPASCASTPATAAATHTGPEQPGGTVTVAGPSYSKTFEVTSCVPDGESGVALRASGSGGFTLAVDATDMTGTLAIDGGTEEDGLTLRGTISALSVGDGGALRAAGTFTRAPGEGSRAFTLEGVCA